MLEEYFTYINIDDDYTSLQIGAQIERYVSTFPSLENKQIAIFGISSDKDSQDGNQIRKEFYKLIAPNTLQNAIVDLGDITQGNSPKDTHIAVTEVVSKLTDLGLTVLFLGNDIEQGEAIYSAFQQKNETIEVSLISPTIPVLEYQLIHRMCTSEPNCLSNINTLAFQAHYIPPKALDVFENLNFGHYRLGLIKKYIEDVELYLRDSAITLFDINAIKHSDAPGKKSVQPSGLSSEEACQLARYSGLSEYAKCFGLFGLVPENDQRHLTATLSAHLLWYFLDGYENRMNDTPDAHSEFMKYRCDFSDDFTPILFLKSKKTSRWWMQIEHPADPQNKNKQLTLPCSYMDYQVAAAGETPERYLNALKRLV